MKRVLVVSDSHGAVDKLDLILSKQPQAKIVFHLGDGTRDLELVKHKYPDKYFHCVEGNWEQAWRMIGDLPEYIVDEIEGKRFFACHGHTFLVKYGLSSLVEIAKAEKASVALYGHTHRQDTHHRDGILFFNPGSVREGKFGAIDVAENGILPVLLNLD
ncbi:MAG: YfcE family phosphodiesterase [Clostridia bacterium]|nr:YfcE family phosphodiesterase [Clostridia bacterium]